LTVDVLKSPETNGDLRISVRSQRGLQALVAVASAVDRSHDTVRAAASAKRSAGPCVRANPSIAPTRSRCVNCDANIGQLSFGALVGGSIGNWIGDWINLEARSEQAQIKRSAQLTGATKEQVGNAIEAVKAALGLRPKQNVDDVRPNGDIIKGGEVVGNV
jgi:hypothetical protein